MLTADVVSRLFLACDTAAPVRQNVPDEDKDLVKYMAVRTRSCCFTS